MVMTETICTSHLPDLIKAGANENLADGRNSTALCIAAEWGHVDCPEIMLRPRAGAGRRRFSSDGGWDGWESCCMLAAGAHVNARDDGGVTVLDASAPYPLINRAVSPHQSAKDPWRILSDFVSVRFWRATRGCESGWGGGTIMNHSRSSRRLIGDESSVSAAKIPRHGAERALHFAGISK
jgi:hypothetical protein